MLEAVSQWKGSAHEKVCSETTCQAANAMGRSRLWHYSPMKLRYTKQVVFQFNDFLYNSFVRYNSEL